MNEVTIAMPVYNVEKYVEKSVNSVLEQTFDNIELLIIDDCGSDNSMTIVDAIKRDYTGRKAIRIIKHDVNKGLSEARNTAIREAQGEYLYFIDSDDYISQDCIEKLYKTIKKENTDFVAGSYQKIHETDERMGSSFILEDKKLKNERDIKEYIFSDFNNNYIIMAGNKLFKLSFIKEKEILFLPNIYYEDVMFSLRTYTSCNSCVFLSAITYFYRQRQGSIMHIGKGSFVEKEIKDLSLIIVVR